MRLDRLRAVVFDLDDTLYPEREYTRSGARAVALALGSPRALAELLALEQEDPRGALYSRWLSHRGMDEARLPGLLRIHREHAPDLALTGEVRAMLARLRKRYRLGLVSDGRLAQQRAKAEALGLAKLLDALVFSDELGRERWKPDPAPYSRVLEQLGVQPEEAVYVGDNPAKDFLGARRAGMRSIRLRRSGGLHAAAEPSSVDAAPDAEVRTLDELETHLG
jgi:putative hydrolase of the HAD superfamily